MATIKLGMLVSQIAGSIGGTTFRRFKNGVVMQNKHRGASSNILLQNTALTQLSHIIRAWRDLSTALKSSWKAESLNYFFTDKFGDQKNITGRQFYIKQTNYLANVGLPPIDPATMTSVVPNQYFLNLQLDSPTAIMVYFNVAMESIYQLIQFEIVSSLDSQPIYNRRKIMLSLGGNVASANNLAFALVNIGVVFKQGDIVRFYITPMNIYGFKGATISKIATVL